MGLPPEDLQIFSKKNPGLKKGTHPSKDYGHRKGIWWALLRLLPPPLPTVLAAKGIGPTAGWETGIQLRPNEGGGSLTWEDLREWEKGVLKMLIFRGKTVFLWSEKSRLTACAKRIRR